MNVMVTWIDNNDGERYCDPGGDDGVVERKSDCQIDVCDVTW